MIDTLVGIYQETLSQTKACALLERYFSKNPPVGPWDLLTVGKVAVSSARACQEFAGKHLQRAFVYSASGYQDQDELGLPTGSCQRWGTHPFPSLDNQVMTREMLSWLRQGQSRELLVVLSGGSSSLLAAPSPPLSLGDWLEIQKCLLASGRAIEDINVVRKHLSEVGGGLLALSCQNRYHKIEQLVFADVSNRALSTSQLLSVVGSGPFAGDFSTKQEALAILETLQGLTPLTKQRAQSALHETPRQTACQSRVLATPELLLHQARSLLGDSALSWEAEHWSDNVSAEVEQVAQHFATTAKRCAERGRKGVFVAVGEPRVVLGQGPSGRGGRCTELCLRFAQAIAGQAGITLLAGTSDGFDGQSTYSGAVVDGHTWPELLSKLGLAKLEQALLGHDSATVLEASPQSLLKGAAGEQNLTDLFLLAVG